MNKSARPSFWRTVIPVTIALAGLLFAWSADRRSLERANRLYREGAVHEAVTIYADRVAREPVSAQLRYNFGTALMGLRNELARETLNGVRTEDDEIQARALYNLGVWSLTQALSAEDLASARANAVSAVAANRSVLRLQPGRADAGWNLAIALRLIASIDAGEDGPRAFMKGSSVPDGPQDLIPQKDVEEGPWTAEGEAAALGAQLDPLPLSEASKVLGTGHRDPTVMVGKLMALEGRASRARASGR